MKKKVSSEHHYKKSKSMKKFSMKAIMMLIPATLSSSSDMNISNAPTPPSPRNHPPEVIKTRSTPTCVTHLDYVNDTGEPRGTMIDLRLRRHMTEIPVSEPPHFLLKFQETVEDLDLEKMLGIPEVYVKGQFYYTPAELDRATNSSYKDYDKEIVLPSEEMEHVLTCVYSDIPAELTLPAEVIKYYITPVNDFADLVVAKTKELVKSTKLGHHVVFIIVSFVGRIRQKSMMTKRAAVESYFKKRANINTYLALWNL